MKRMPQTLMGEIGWTDVCQSGEERCETNQIAFWLFQHLCTILLVVFFLLVELTDSKPWMFYHVSHQ